MLVSFPLLAARRMIAQAIATSGVSEVDNGEVPAVPPGAWRAHSGAISPYLHPTPTCPDCGILVVRASACLMCPSCGWGKCG